MMATTKGEHPVDDARNLQNPSPRSIGIATAAALTVSIVVLLAFVLPAEFGVDPLGTGEVLGLNALSGPSDNPLQAQPEVHKNDYAEFILGPFQSVEYKYLMDIDSTMVFTWTADGELFYDFHAEPAGLGAEYAVSFEAGLSERGMGSFHAPFTGVHGWFWENRSFDTITIRVYSAGFYVNGTVFQDGGSFERQLQSVSD